MNPIGNDLDILRKHIQTTGADNPDVIAAFAHLEGWVAEAAQLLNTANTNIVTGAVRLGVGTHFNESAINDVLPRVVETARKRITDLEQRLEHTKRMLTLMRFFLQGVADETFGDSDIPTLARHHLNTVDDMAVALGKADERWQSLRKQP